MTEPNAVHVAASSSSNPSTPATRKSTDNPYYQKKKKKSKKIKEPVPPVPEGWTRCQVYLTKKHRYCRQLRLENSIYCGNHQDQDDHSFRATNHDNSNNNNNNVVNSTTTTKRKRKRILCPLDQSHTIYEDMLKRHMQICPKAKLQQEQERQAYYHSNTNGGGHGKLEIKSIIINNNDTSSTSTTNTSTSTSRNSHTVKSQEHLLEQAQQLALRILYVHQQLFASTKTLPGARHHHHDLRRVTVDDIESALPLQDLSYAELEAGLKASVESYHIRSGGTKHLQQQASLLGHVRKLSSSSSVAMDKNTNQHNHNHNHSNNNNDDENADKTKNDTLILELGAGRGMLGLITAGALAAASSNNNNNNNNVDLIMIERAGTRSKADTILRNHKSTLEDRCIKIENVRHWQRIQCDLAHVHMPTVLELHHKKISATTMAPPGNNTKSSSSSSSSPPHIMAIAKHLCGAGTDLALKALYPIRDQIQVCLMATCCHGVCTWEHYVGRDYLMSALTNKTTTTTTTTTTKQGTNNDDHDNDSVPCLTSFGLQEFELMRLWSSGTVKDACCTGEKTSSSSKDNKDEGEDSHHNVCTDSKAEGKAVNVATVVSSLQLECGVQGLGRACQRLLDYGRKEYLERVIFANDKDVTAAANGKQKNAQIELCYYVPSSVTPQNAVLVASRR